MGTVGRLPLAVNGRARLVRKNTAAWRGSTALLRCMLAAGAMLAGGAAHAAPALPTGGSVASGTVTIGTPSGGSLTINQSSNKAIVNATGSATGTSYVGGLVGWNRGAVSYAYASGAVSGSAYAGGFAGWEIAPLGPFTDDYWDIIATGHTNGTGSGSPAGLVAVGGRSGNNPLAQATYVGFDFTNVWVFTPGHRPTLIGVQ